MEDAKSKRGESRKPQMTTRRPPPHGASPPQNPTCQNQNQTQTQTQNQTDVKKRKHMEDSPYFKLRALLQQLRPHFIEVLGTPDFWYCKSAEEIQRQVKLLMALNKHMTMETGTQNSQKKFASEQQQHSSHNRLPAKENKYEVPKQQVQPRCSVEEQFPSAKWTHFIPEKKSFVSSQLPQSYIVGGSVFGWNFIIFSGGNPVYYGVTKGSYRSSHSRSGDDSMLSTDDSSGQGKPSMWQGRITPQFQCNEI